MLTRITNIAVGAVAAVALSVGPAYAFAPGDSPGAGAPGQANAQSGGCLKQLDYKQKSNANAHKGAGGENNYPTNCDHFFNPQGQ